MFRFKSITVCLLLLCASTHMIKLFGDEAYRGAILHFLDNLKDNKEDDFSFEYFEDGILIVSEGKIKAVGPSEFLLSTIPEDTQLIEYKSALIMPGLIDTHIHFPQTDMIASYGEQLLEWLEKYTFPNERRFKDKKYAQKVSGIFIQELLRNGTTSALVFCAGTEESVEALFEEALQHNMRLIAGKAIGDQNLPSYLLQTADTTYEDNKRLIHKWHNQGRLLYALTPRFAPTSSEAQLKIIGDLLKEFPDVYLHTHLSENLDEIKWVKQLFPWSSDYLEVYEHFGFLRRKALFAHSIFISDEEIDRLVKTESAVSFCPTSNLFLGSGLFNWEKCRKASLKIGIGTDIGAGTSFSMLHTLGDGYKIAQLQKQKLSPLEAFYYATLGGAKALDIDKAVGNFEIGKEADFIVLDLCSTALFQFRIQETSNLSDKLFLLMILGDDRNVKETYVMGKRVWCKK